MNYTFLVQDGKICKWLPNMETPIAKIGDPLSVEFKHIRIVSKNFDYFGNSEVMVVNHIKNCASKDRAIQQITYYDTTANPTKIINTGGKKTFTISSFDASEYGYPVCFHTPGYQGTMITITTKFWEIDDPATITTVLNMIKSGLGILGSTIPGYGTYFTIASGALSVGTRIITDIIKHDELAPNHVFELRTDDVDKPLYIGTYLCIPNIVSLEERDNILANCVLDENHLGTYKDGKWKEYPNTYFILQVANTTRPELSDFDYTASAADVLQKLYDPKKQDDLHKDIVNLTQQSYSLGLLKVIQSTYAEFQSNPDKLPMLRALYNQIPPDQLSWFESTIPQITSALL